MQSSIHYIQIGSFTIWMPRAYIANNIILNWIFLQNQIGDCHVLYNSIDVPHTTNFDHKTLFFCKSNVKNEVRDS